MSFLDLFKKKQKLERFSDWREFGSYQSRFYAFGSDIYMSEAVRQAVRPIARHTSKAFAHCNKKPIETLLNYEPNIYMNGKDFLEKIRTRIEIYNTVFIWIQRDETGLITGLYPVPYSSFTALEYNDRLFVRFEFTNSSDLVVAWDDLAVLRKDYNSSDIAGDSNKPIYSSLELMNTTNQGISNAVKSTANLRGILKSTKAMLSDDDIKKQKDRFVADYMNLENDGGIASLDSTQEFTPITMNPTIVSWEQRKQFKDDIYDYFGVSESIIRSDYTEEQMNAFYGAMIEPFLLALSLELTRKVFTARERAFGASIVYESNRLQFASMSTKIAMFKEVVQYGGMTINEWRLGCNMAPIEGGDELIRRLDAAVVKKEGEENEDGSEG